MKIFLQRIEAHGVVFQKTRSNPIPIENLMPNKSFLQNQYAYQAVIVL